MSQLSHEYQTVAQPPDAGMDVFSGQAERIDPSVAITVKRALEALPGFDENIEAAIQSAETALENLVVKSLMLRPVHSSLIAEAEAQGVAEMPLGIIATSDDVPRTEHLEDNDIHSAIQEQWETTVKQQDALALPGYIDRSYGGLVLYALDLYAISGRQRYAAAEATYASDHLDQILR